MFIAEKTLEKSEVPAAPKSAFPDCTAWSDIPCQVCGLSVGASAGAFVGAVQKIRILEALQAV